MSEQKTTRGQRRKQQQEQKKKQKKPAKTWMKRVLIALVAIGLVGLIAGGSVYAYYASTAPDLDEELLKDPISPKLLDANGEEFATVGSESREYIPYEEIPQQMEDAILATEDARFYDHMGVDVLRLGKAVLANLKDGFGAQGASTITQQVVKNSFFTNEKTIKRKVQEAHLALQLEREYKKEEIFEMYFNKVLMSGRIYGFGTAAQYFYGKDLKDLELHEIAVLAGMPQSPNNFNPFKNPERAEKRRNTVLYLMNLHGKITDAEMKEAQAIPVTDSLLPEEERVSKQNSKYDAFIDIVLDELEKNGDATSISEGITIYTTLQPKAQQQVEATLSSDIFPTEDIESGVAVIDTKTGAVVAAGGGRNYGDARGYNHAQDMVTRSPGSTIKPLIDYGPAVEYLGWSPAQTIEDKEIKYTGTNQVIRNADNKYLGTMTMREALYKSRNTTAVQTLREVGTKNSREFISRFGVDIGTVNEAYAIGGISKFMSPIQIAGAYAAFGNGGIHTEPYAINKIVYRDGKTEKNYKPESKVVMKDSTAYIITDVLRDVLTKGTGKAAAISGLDVAGKSGTSNFGGDKKGVPDVWFAGYTTNYSVTVWSGYDDNSAITTAEERSLSQRIFKEVMGNISEGQKTERFKKPNSVVEVTIERGSNPLKLASEYTPEDMKLTELFVKGTEPKQVSEEYEQLELNAPTNLSVKYDETTSSATLDWDYEKPESEKDVNVQFEVAVSIDNGPKEVLQTTDKTGLIVQSLTAGKKYVFTVTAIAEDVRSESASVELVLEGIEEEDLEEPEPEDNPDENADDENKNQDGNGNSNNNGNNGNNNNSGNNNGNNTGNNNSNNGNGNPGSGNTSGNNTGNTGSGQGNTGGTEEENPEDNPDDGTEEETTP